MGSGLSSAEIVRDRPAESVPTFKDVAADIVGQPKTPAQIVAEAPKPPSSDEMRAARLARDDAQEKARRGQLERAKNEKAQFNAVTLEVQEFAEKNRALAEKAKQGPQTPPQPSRGLRPFLASSENDPPENVIAKFLQTASLFATMIGGGRAGARASLSAMTGALEGWQAGDRWRGDRAYADWKAKTNAMFEQWEQEMRGYQIALRAEGVPIEQRMRLLDLEARNNQNFSLAENASVADAQKFVAELEKRQGAYVDLQMEAAKIDAMKHASDQKHEEAIKRLEEMARGHLALEGLKQQNLDIKRQVDQQALTNMGNLSETSWAKMGQDYFLEGKLPQMGRSSGAFKARVIEEGTKWALANGLDPMASPSIRTDMAAARKTVIDLTDKLGVQRASISRLDSHLDRLVELSDKFDRSEMPAINKALLTGALQYSGSPGAAAYFQQALEVAFEQARVQVGTAQGDANSRQETRNSIAVGYNKEQVRTVADNLRGNARRSIAANEEAIGHYRGIMERFQGAKGPEATKPGEAKSGQTETVPRSNAAYQRARKSGLTDQQIEEKYKIKLVD